MNSNLPRVTEASDTAPIQLLVVTAQTIMADNNATQRHVADKQAETEGHRVKLESERLNHHASHTRFAMRTEFMLKLVGILFLAGVVTAGFVTGNTNIVTHAITLAAGIGAGVGLARRGGG